MEPSIQLIGSRPSALLSGNVTSSAATTGVVVKSEILPTNLYLVEVLLGSLRYTGISARPYAAGEPVSRDALSDPANSSQQPSQPPNSNDSRPTELRGIDSSFLARLNTKLDRLQGTSESEWDRSEIISRALRFSASIEEIEETIDRIEILRKLGLPLFRRFVDALKPTPEPTVETRSRELLRQFDQYLREFYPSSRSSVLIAELERLLGPPANRATGLVLKLEVEAWLTKAWDDLVERDPRLREIQLFLDRSLGRSIEARRPSLGLSFPSDALADLPEESRHTAVRWIKDLLDQLVRGHENLRRFREFGRQLVQFADSTWIGDVSRLLSTPEDRSLGVLHWVFPDETVWSYQLHSNEPEEEKAGSERERRFRLALETDLLGAVRVDGRAWRRGDRWQGVRLRLGFSRATSFELAQASLSDLVDQLRDLDLDATANCYRLEDLRLEKWA